MSILRKLFSRAKEKDENQLTTNWESSTVDLSRVYPRIKAVFSDQYPDSVQSHTSSEISLSHDDSPVFKSYAEGIAIFYTLDMGDSYQFIQNRQLSGTITLDTLHDAALTNMAKAISDKTEVNGDPDNVMMVTNGGNFEATMLLADFLWEQLEPIFNDKLCVAIPAKDLLFISASSNPVGRESLRSFVRFYFEEHQTEGLIVRHIYERSNSGWELVETA
ncbi:MAG TPA: DUF1444 family protein [Flavisolibacter sp.]|nr:DUF1444 family protein [Flavisolibacter sp.]